MNVATTYPGVYVLEVPSGVRTIAAVSTSVTMFIGATQFGPINQPRRLFNYSDFARQFGEDTSIGDMARHLRLFFLNGGTDCYVMRIAAGATAATVQLQAADTTPVLELTARQAGRSGDMVRARVTYDSSQPETTFNLELWRAETLPAGGTTQADLETFRNLSMNPASPLYAPDILTQQSKLVTAAEIPAGGPTAGFSQAGRPVPYTDATPVEIRDRIEAVLADHGALRLAVAGSVPVDVDLTPANVPQIDPVGDGLTSAQVLTEYATRLTALINTALVPVARTVTVSFEAGPTPVAGDGDNTALLRITADDADASVHVVPAPDPADIAVHLMIGGEQGGLEIGAFAATRPAPSGLALSMDAANLLTLMGAQQDAIQEVSLPERQPDDSFAPVSIPVDLEMTAAAEPLYRASNVAFPGENANGVRLALETIRDAINDYRDAHPDTFPWAASVAGLRLLIQPEGEAGDLFTGALTSSDGGGAGLDLGPLMVENVKNYVLGAGGTLGLQTPGAAGFDGNPPTADEYEDAFDIIDSEVDIFNLMCLPPTAGSALDMADIYRPASVFCQRRRAFLLMDPPIGWNNAQTASTGVSALKIGLVKDHAAIYYPRLQITEDGRQHFVGPSGAVAGLMTRIDGSRGIWKAPAGTEGDIRGISGVEYPFSDMENGILNPRAINVIRQFPNGIVSWGARTMDGDDSAGSEYKYVPIRRLALFIEESLYRGLQWVTFEPNDEPLWAQIRLNAGAFMHTLFRQGAFQGQTKNDAYFVKCDSETTTATDQNLGRVNVWIGFAPLKPAEFVILRLQQIAGQIET
ncbi:phage tail sheath C-terminal domain-containing protein [Nitratireductor sp. XY-223]|uniref:phage tail sheath family protein n=1 Tax=Nitratireductor sp. XY-223 TaxID=2561926 RepID=UPI00145A5D35|nr:phage tail sheath C-terminal domain-containing protein [Nitratireductor sp. XY-223]